MSQTPHSYADNLKNQLVLKKVLICACIVFVASKGFWAEMLGVGDFYYELGVQIVEVCMATNHRNGGKVYNDAHYL